jgi:hypothetical protein
MVEDPITMPRITNIIPPVIYGALPKINIKSFAGPQLKKKYGS